MDEQRRRPLTLAVAAGGVLAGHWLTYLADVPDSAHRATVLAGTGHGYLPVAGELVSALMAISIAAAFLGRVLSVVSAPAPGRSLVIRLAVMQIGGFVAMEVLERLAAGIGPSALLHGAILPLGIAVNAGVALIGAALLRSILRAADLLTTALLGRRWGRRERASVRLSAVPASPRGLRAVLPAPPVRGPPSPVCT